MLSAWGKKSFVMVQGLPLEFLHVGSDYLAKVFWMPTVPSKVLMSTSCAEFGKGLFCGCPPTEKMLLLLFRVFTYNNDLYRKSYC